MIISNSLTFKMSLRTKFHRCPKCQSFFVSEEKYSLHSLKCGKVKCDSCDKFFKTKANLNRHKASAHKKGGLKYECLKCHYVTTRSDNFKRHRNSCNKKHKLLFGSRKKAQTFKLRKTFKCRE